MSKVFIQKKLSINIPKGWKTKTWKHLPNSGWIVTPLLLTILIFSWFVALVPLGYWELKLTGCDISDETVTSENYNNYIAMRSIKYRNMTTYISLETVLKNKKKDILLTNNYYYRKCINPFTTFFFPLPEQVLQGNRSKTWPKNLIFELIDQRGGWLKRHLNLSHKVITSNKLTAEVLNKLKTDKKRDNKDALNKVIGLPLNGRTLRFADFSNSWLPKIEMGKLSTTQQTHLQGTVFNNAYMEGANLQLAQLQGASLMGVNLNNSNLGGINLKESMLWNANFQNSYLRYASFNGAKFSTINFQGSILDGAHLQGVSLWEANFRGTSLNQTQFQGSFLSEAQLQGAKLSNTWFKGADLSKANLSGSLVWNNHEEIEPNFDNTNLDEIKYDILTKELAEEIVSGFAYQNSATKEEIILSQEKILAYKPRLHKVKSNSNIYCSDKTSTKIHCVNKKQYLEKHIEWIEKKVCHNYNARAWSLDGYRILRATISHRRDQANNDRLENNSYKTMLPYYKKLLELVSDQKKCPAVSTKYLNMKGLISQP